MAWKFNPFTGTLDEAGSGGGGVTNGDKGDITVSSGGNTWTIDNGAVTLAKQANVATATVFYRKTAGTGAPEVQTLATLKTDLDLTGTNSGDQTITLTGDVTGSGTGSFAATIANGAVGTAKLGGDITTAGKALLDDVDASAQRTTLGAAASGAITGSGLTTATSRILGRTSASTGAVEELTVGSGLSLSGGSLSAPAPGGNLFLYSIAY